MYDFDSIYKMEYGSKELLIENTPLGTVAHVPEDFHNNYSNSLKKDYRRLMGCDIEIKKGYKYLWYYEYCRYKKIDLFNELVDLFMNAIYSNNNHEILQLYEIGYDIAKEISDYKREKKSIEEEIYLDEVVRSIFFIMDMYIPLGCGHKQIYLKIAPLLMHEDISFLGFVSCNTEEIKNVELLQQRKLIDLLQRLRDQVTLRFCNLNIFDYDYYDKRKDLICNTLRKNNEESYLQELIEKMEPLNKKLLKKYAVRLQPITKTE